MTKGYDHTRGYFLQDSSTSGKQAQQQRTSKQHSTRQKAPLQ